MARKLKQNEDLNRLEANRKISGAVDSVFPDGASSLQAIAYPQAQWIWLIAIGLLYVLLRIHALAIPLDRDEGVFGYTAQRILEGGKPYQDALDHKPPGVFYIYALALRFFPATPVGVHLFLLLYNLLTLIIVALLIRSRFPSSVAWLGGAFCYAVFSASPAIQGFTASTEMLALLPTAACLLLAIVGKRRGHPVLILASGAAGAAAFWIKQTAATSALFAIVYLLAGTWLDDRIKRESFSRRLRDLLFWSTGAVMISTGVAGYFYASGVFPEFMYWSFTHNVTYAGQIPINATIASVLQSLGEILRGDFLVVGLGIAVALWKWSAFRSESLFVLSFIVSSLVGALPGFAYAHYFAQLAPAVAVASGWALSLIAKNGKPAGVAFWLLIVGLVVTPLYTHWDFFVQLPAELLSRSFFGTNPFPESTELSSFLAARTSEQDRIFIFGSEPEILFQAHRKSATPFAMIYPLTRQYPRYREFQRQVWHDIQHSEPAYILVVNIPSSILYDGKAELQIVDHLKQLIAKQYEMAAVMPVGGYQSRLILINAARQLKPDMVPDNANILVFHRSRIPEAQNSASP